MAKFFMLFGLVFVYSTLGHTRDIRINDCSAFIDKAVTKFHKDEYYYRTEVAVFIKINPRFLPAREVGFIYQEARTNGSQWKKAVLKSFVGSRDYFVLNGLETEHDYTSMIGANSYTGAFYIVAKDGNKYWLNNATGGNFIIDPRLAESITQRHNYGDSKDKQIPIPVGSLRKTGEINAGAEIYLNPNRCW